MSNYGGPQSYTQSSGGQIQPGAITYTTSTGPDGETVYHPFKAVPASYQTPQGVVSGIQWIPAEATSILPAGAQPATAEFAASWGRDRGVDKWQRSEERRRKKEEKESIKRLSKQFERDREDNEVRIQRQRSRSFYGESGAPPYSPGYNAYPHSPSNELDRKFNDLDINGRSAAYGNRPRKYSTTGGDRMYGVSPSEAGYAGSAGSAAYAGAGSTSPYRQPAYTTSPNIRSQDTFSYPGGPDPIARAASPYARGNDPIARAASPYGRPPMEPIARASSPYGRPLNEPMARATSPYGRPLTEPISRAPSPYHPGYVPRAPSPVPPRAPSPYSAAHSPYVPRAPSPLPGRAPSPYAKPPPPYLGGAPSQYQAQASHVYPPGHPMDGQPFPRSRAPSPMPGPPAAFPTSPRMPVSVAGADQQLSVPDAFSRPANAAQPYTPFATMKIQDMEQFYDQIPRMPLVLDTHDVYHHDWIRFMNDLALGWAGKLPLPDLSRGPPPRRSVLVADLVDLWNDSFFLPRRVEVVLCKGHERRSGPNKGVIDYQLPGFDVDYDSDDTSSSTSSDSESDVYPGYGRSMDLAESKRRIKEKAEKKIRKKEKKVRRKAKEREKTYALYLTYVPPRDPVFTGVHGYYV